MQCYTLLDILTLSAFEWQRDHNSKPLTIVVDEIKDLINSGESPLRNIITQGRKFGTRLIGITQQYIDQHNHAIGIMKEAGIKVFFKPSSSHDRIANELGYKNGTDAGFGSMRRGEFILNCDLYNKIDGVNDPAVIYCKAIEFKNTLMYEKLKVMFGNIRM